MTTRTFLSSDADTVYPAIEDAYLGATRNTNPHLTRVELPSDHWEDHIGQPTQTHIEFSGTVYVSLSDVNWRSIPGKDLSTSVFMNLDGITAEDLPTTKPGTVNVQVIKDTVPGVFHLPFIDQTTGLREDNTYAFAVDGLASLDYVQFSLIKFDAQKWDGADNLQLYYQYLEDQSKFVNQNGSLLFNHTYDYKTMTEYDKGQLESDFQVGGEDEVRYSLLSVRNTTARHDLFQTYTLTKRSAYRQNSVATAHGTINFVEYHYLIQISRYAKPGNLQDAFKVKLTRNSPAGVPIPITPFFKTANYDYINVASLTGNKGIYQAYVPQTYIDMIPTIVLISAYIGIMAIMGGYIIYWNNDRFKEKAYSIPFQLINYVFYHPENSLHPLTEKIASIELSMTDGYDPQLGYNHLGIMSVHDANRITMAEPDVPYGTIHRKPSVDTKEEV